LLEAAARVVVLEPLGGLVKARNVWRGLCVALAVVVGALVAAPASSATTDAARLAAAGIDVGAIAPGWSIVGDEVWWDGGQIRRTLDDAADYPCSAGWLCIYRDANFKGYMFVAQDPGEYLYLADYGFNDQASSWINRRSADGRWWYHEKGQPNPYRCINSQATMGNLNSDNDQMSTVVLYTSPSVC
jgi:hypothetical protein